MSTLSIPSPTSPTPQRDIRSPSVPSKRDRDAIAKWSLGMRPSSGVRISPFETLTSSTDPASLIGGSESQRQHIRPEKMGVEPNKAHTNITTKPNPGRGFYHHGSRTGTVKKADAIVESRDGKGVGLERSLLDLLPTYRDAEEGVRVAPDAGVFYSFDKAAGPGAKMNLGGLVERAERKWESERTERIVRGEYEVLGLEGETLRVGKGKKGRGGSPKLKEEVRDVVDEDEGFELV